MQALCFKVTAQALVITYLYLSPKLLLSYFIFHVLILCHTLSLSVRVWKMVKYVLKLESINNILNHHLFYFKATNKVWDKQSTFDF